MPQPPLIEPEPCVCGLTRRDRAKAGRCFDIENRYLYHAIIDRVGGTAEHLLIYAEEAGECLSVFVIELSRRAALDELLYISGVAAEQPRYRSVALSTLEDQPVEFFPDVFHLSVLRISIVGIFLDSPI